MKIKELKKIYQDKKACINLLVFVFFLIILLSFWKADVFGNVADWISGIGSLIAIVFVYIQIRVSQNQSSEQIKESRNQLQKQLKTERERNFQQARPLFKIVKKSNVSLNDIMVSSDKYRSFVYKGADFVGVTNRILRYSENQYSKEHDYYFLKNISENRMMGVRVEFYFQKPNSTDNGVRHFFYIDTIDGDDAIKLVDDLLLATKEENLKKITVTFNTSMREILSLVFNVDENGIPIYNRKLSYIENKDSSDKMPRDYDLNNFEESNYSPKNK